ncbi:MAG: hypothetical protein HYW01_11805 [Deltaproteobacteria bacterium]|nr:hypothetical protein [Deltaproteobacteria bacterium]
MTVLSELLTLLERERNEEQHKLYSLLNEIMQEIKSLREELGLKNNKSREPMKNIFL